MNWTGIICWILKTNKNLCWVWSVICSMWNTDDRLFLHQKPASNGLPPTPKVHVSPQHTHTLRAEKPPHHFRVPGPQTTTGHGVISGGRLWCISTVKVIQSVSVPQMGACFSKVFNGCPLKIHSAASWISPDTRGTALCPPTDLQLIDQFISCFHHQSVFFSFH